MRASPVSATRSLRDTVHGMSAQPVCCACGQGGLAPHLAVAGTLGADGLIPTTDQFGTALSDIVRCDDCGHMQLAIMPAEAELELAYADAASEDYVDEEAGQRETARRVLARIEAARSGQRGHLLDLGCWVGFLLSEATRRGWTVTGVEPSAFASAYARDRLGLDVRTEDLFTAELPLGGYDAVVLGDVLEHLPDPGAALDRIGDLLAPGGVAWFALPDAGSRVARGLGARWWSVIPTHVQYFTRASVRRLLERHGYEVVSVTTAPKAFSVAYYLGRIGGYSKPLGDGLVRLATLAGQAERMWAPDFRDRIAVIARPRS